MDNKAHFRILGSAGVVSGSCCKLPSLIKCLHQEMAVSSTNSSWISSIVALNTHHIQAVTRHPPIIESPPREQTSFHTQAEHIACPKPIPAIVWMGTLKMFLIKHNIRENVAKMTSTLQKGRSSGGSGES